MMPNAAFCELMSLMMWIQLIGIGGMFLCFVLMILLDSKKKD